MRLVIESREVRFVTPTTFSVVPLSDSLTHTNNSGRIFLFLRGVLFVCGCRYIEKAHLHQSLVERTDRRIVSKDHGCGNNKPVRWTCYSQPLGAMFKVRTPPNLK